MRSRYFSRHNAADDELKDVRDGVAAIARLSDDALRKCVDATPTLALTRRPDVEKDIEDRLPNEVGEEPLVVTDALVALRFFFLIFADRDYHDEVPERLVDDLITSGWLPETKRAAMLDALTDLQRAAIDNELLALRNDAVSGPVPLLRSVKTAVDLRAVNRQRYTVNTEPAQFVPEIVEYVPLASVQLRMSGGSESQHCLFQVDRSGLEVLLRLLQATLREMDAAETFWLGRTNQTETKS